MKILLLINWKNTKKDWKHILDLKEWNKNFGDVFNIYIRDGNHNDKELCRGWSYKNLWKWLFHTKRKKIGTLLLIIKKNHLMLLRNLPLNNHMTLIFKIFLELLYICVKGGYVGESQKTFNNFLNGNFPIKV